MDNPIFTRCLSQAGRERTQYIHNIASQYPWVCMAVSFNNREIFTEQKGFLKQSGTPNIKNLAFIYWDTSPLGFLWETEVKTSHYKDNYLLNTAVALFCFTGGARTCEKQFLLEKLFTTRKEREHNLFCLFKMCWNKSFFFPFFLHIFQMNNSLERCALYFTIFVFKVLSMTSVFILVLVKYLLLVAL